MYLIDLILKVINVIWKYIDELLINVQNIENAVMKDNGLLIGNQLPDNFLEANSCLLLFLV